LSEFRNPKFAIRNLARPLLFALRRDTRRASGDDSRASPETLYFSFPTPTIFEDATLLISIPRGEEVLWTM